MSLRTLEREAIATALLPAQWALLRPLRALGDGLNYVETVEAAQSAAQDAQRQLAAMGLQARQAQELEEENRRLRELLQLRPRLQVPALAAEVVYESPDNYTRRVILDKGQVAGVLPGSPVVDERGVLGQVVRVQPFTSEVRLLVDRDLAIPVLIERTGVRGIVYGRASNLGADVVELRYISGDVDIQEGDVLLTSGIDGVYPARLPVARIMVVERQGATAFLRIDGQPMARMQGARHVMVLAPWQEALAAQLPAAAELRALVAPRPMPPSKRVRTSLHSAAPAAVCPDRRSLPHDHAARRTAVAARQPLVHCAEHSVCSAAQSLAHRQLGGHARHAVAGAGLLGGAPAPACRAGLGLCAGAVH